MEIDLIGHPYAPVDPLTTTDKSRLFGAQKGHDFFGLHLVINS